MTERDLQRVLSNSVQDVHLSDEARRRIRQATKEERPVTSKKFVAIVLAVMLALTASVGIAAELGLFGRIGQSPNADSRLPGLENVSTVMNKVFNVDNGVTVTVNQAYYDGSRVFISYMMQGPHDMLETGTGQPDLVNYDQKYDDVIFADKWFVEGPNGPAIMSWLDGSEPRWAKTTCVNVHDGLQIGDEYLDIIGGEFYYLEDGTLMSWKECIVPEALAADEVTFSIGIFTTNSTYYQTAESLYTFGVEVGETTWHPFTVKKDDRSTTLTGSVQTLEWDAKATLNASAIDLKGEIIVKGPDGWTDIWTNWENPGKLDYINDWKLYVNGEKVDGYNLDGGVRAMEDGKVAFGICYKLDSLSTDMKLVPVYRYAGEKMDEAITLQ